MSTAVPEVSEQLRYPVGRFQAPETGTPGQLKEYIATIAECPARLRAAISGLHEEQLDTPYRPGGWTVRQVVHHVPESHMNAYIRFKLALTEESPTIKPYDEARWAETGEVWATPLEVSLALLENLHARWVNLLQGMTPGEWARTYVHPEYNKTFRLDTVAAMYAWHSRHHVAHVMSLRMRNGW